MGTPVTFIPQSGIQRDFSPYENPPGSFQRLTNARLVPGKGRVEQTPYFYASSSWAVGSYYNAGAVTETGFPLSLTMKLGTSQIQLSREVARIDGVQIKVFKQTAFPTGSTATTLQGGCYLQINSASSLAITLGNSLDIVIDGATTFKWRKNGGAFTTVVPITTTGVSIDGGNATVFFLTASGFTVGDTWSWTRTDWLSEATFGGNFVNDWSYALDAAKLYFVDNAGRVMLLDVTSSTNYYAISVGYRPIYGSHVAIYYKHLFVLGVFASPSTATNPGPSGVRSDNIANSDLNDYNAFFETDTNEADFFSLSTNTLQDNKRDAAGFYGASVINGIFHVYTCNRIWTTSYDGLPTPFSFQEFRKISLSTNFVRPVSTENGDYFMSTHGVVKFDGNYLTPISGDVCEIIDRSPILTSFTWGFYHVERAEVHFFCGNESTDAGTAGWYVYQEITNSWYFRAASFSSYPCSAAVSNGSVMLQAGSLIVTSIPLTMLTEDAAGSQNTIVKDFDLGASFQLPLIEMSDQTFGSIAQVNDLEDSYLDTFYQVPVGTAYATTGVVIDFSTRNYDKGTVTYPGGTQTATWTTASTDGTLSLRGSGRLWRFRVQPTVSAGKVPYAFEFNTFIAELTGVSETEVTR